MGAVFVFGSISKTDRGLSVFVVVLGIEVVVFCDAEAQVFE